MEDSTSEDMIGLNHLGLSSHQADFNDALNPYLMANEIWHYSSVDWGRRCESSQMLRPYKNHSLILS